MLPSWLSSDEYLNLYNVVLSRMFVRAYMCVCVRVCARWLCVCEKKRLIDCCCLSPSKNQDSEVTSTLHDTKNVFIQDNVTLIIKSTCTIHFFMHVCHCSGWLVVLHLYFRLVWLSRLSGLSACLSFWWPCVSVLTSGRINQNVSTAVHV